VTQVETQSFTPVVFLDTNAVHYARVLLAFGQKHALDPFEAEFAAFDTKLQEQGVRAISEFRHGYLTVRYLRQWCDTGGRVLYSPITTLELFCNGLRAVALLRAAKSDVPYRWFSHFGEKDVRGHLAVDGYAEAIQGQVALKDLFNNAGISAEECELTEEIWRMAQAILRSIFLDVQDSLVYASAIVEQAREVVTGDGYLGETVAYAENPGGAGEFQALFASVRAQLLQSYQELTRATDPPPVLPVRKRFQDMI
jgi:hypothetical protein